MKKIDGYWVEGTNKWNIENYTKETAIVMAKTLINCKNCINCRSCINCRDCLDCRSCINCINCSFCLDCSDCINCSFCSFCINCLACSSCRDYKSNPNRISSKLIGSRTSQTTIYILNDNIQVVCGCFKGNLLEFEQRIKEVYPTGEHHDDYMEFIEFAKSYIKYLEVK